MLRMTGLSQSLPGRGIKGVGLFLVNLQMHEAGKAASHLFSKTTKSFPPLHAGDTVNPSTNETPNLLLINLSLFIH